MIFEKLVAVLADHVDCDPSSVTMDTTFEELGIELELDEKISTVGEMVKLVEEKMGEKE